MAFFFPNPQETQSEAHDVDENERKSSAQEFRKLEERDHTNAKKTGPTQPVAKPVYQPKPSDRPKPAGFFQRTLALIRPSAFAQHRDKILQRIKDSQFEIAMHKTIKFDKSQAEEFYAEQKNQPFFNDLVAEMSSGPMMVLCLVKEDAIKAWRDLLGPKEKDQVKNTPGT